jgi:hypothetical protein
MRQPTKEDLHERIAQLERLLAKATAENDLMRELLTRSAK